MIIEFSVKNYRSIKDLQTLSMVAAPIKSKYPELDVNNVIKVSDKLSLLKSVAIYGANGSGKSNLVKAAQSMLIFIRDSFKNEKIGKQIIEPFALNIETPNQSTFFQLIFILDNVRYRYGFEVFQNEVKSEWLFGTPEKSEIHYFKRESSSIKINEIKFSEGKGLQSKTSDTNLFLNVVKAFNGKLSKQIFEYLTENIAVSIGVNDLYFRNATIPIMQNEYPKKRMLSLLNLADVGIQDVIYKKIPSELIHTVDGFYFTPEEETISSVRKFYNNDEEEALSCIWNIEKNESDGTQKFFNYSGVIINVLGNGGTLVLDEFDARLHPMLTKKIVEMFNSPTINKNGAQLVFVTHDTNLLDNSLLRRDQIYFTEKNKMQETVLYSLADFKGVRNDASYEKDYINGKYGAIPFLGNFEKLFES
ncbi:MAG: ATP/GTP-binding protein [Prolixibacteraceae bacterium]